MAYSPLPSPEVLRQLLECNPDTGKLYWKERGPEWFEDGRISAQGHANRWNARHAGKEALASDHNGYRHGAIFGRLTLAHRVIWALHYGEWPRDCIDHINGDRSDNRIENLRDVSHAENLKNKRQRVDNTSGHAGVSWCKLTGKWYAKVSAGGIQHSLGRFSTKREAIRVRQSALADLGFHQNHA